jgi:hypothetical protein
MPHKLGPLDEVIERWQKLFWRERSGESIPVRSEPVVTCRAQCVGTASVEVAGETLGHQLVCA